jgi:hypothetical protein
MTETLNDFPYFIALAAKAYQDSSQFALRAPIKGNVRNAYVLAAMYQDCEPAFTKACEKRYGVTPPPFSEDMKHVLEWIELNESKLLEGFASE